MLPYSQHTAIVPITVRPAGILCSAELWLGVLAGDANMDGYINMGDVTKVERIILGIDPPTPSADANQDGSVDMGDVTKIERIILGIDEAEIIKITTARAGFTSTGEYQAVEFPVTMPEWVGKYKVYIDVYIGEVMIGGYVANQDVVIEVV